MRGYKKDAGMEEKNGSIVKWSNYCHSNYSNY